MRSLLLVACLAACSGAPSTIPDDAVRALARGGAARVLLDGARVTGVAVAIEPSQLPDTVRRIGEALLPGDSWVLCAREWSAAGVGFRLEKQLGAGQFRTALLDAQGEVLERTHEVPLAQAPRVAHAGVLVRCEVVQRAPGEEAFRLTFTSDQAPAEIVECSVDGRVVSEARVTRGVELWH
jgi:hypothetical protein